MFSGKTRLVSRDAARGLKQQQITARLYLSKECHLRPGTVSESYVYSVDKTRSVRHALHASYVL